MKEKLKLAGRAVLAALTSPEAVKKEKSLAVLVLTRLVVTLGGSAAAVELVARVIGAL